MFYIEKIEKLNSRDAIHIVPTLIVFVAFFGITIWNWLQLRNDLAISRQNILSKNVQGVSNNIGGNISNKEDVLNAGTGLFDASQYVSGKEWEQFVGIFNLPTRYPAVASMGFAKVLTKNESGSYTKQIEAKENSRLSIRPASDRTSYAPIVFSQPHNLKNSRSVGYDLYSNSLLKSAMIQAANSGGPAISAKITPFRGSPFDRQSEFVIFTPIYTKNSKTDTVSQRRQNIWGYIYAEIISYKLLNQFYSPSSPNFAFRIYDSDQANGPIIYQSPNFETEKNKGDTETLVQQFGVNNRRWTIEGISSPDAISPSDRQRPATALWGGLLFSVFLAIFIYTLLLNRTRALSEKDEKQIQSAKDELLALASHQLRTPATGVKQYIGMLIEGYGGKLNREQKKYLKQAYLSNERQLGIINDMLFVARADTGDIDYLFEKTDLLSLLKEILREQNKTIKDKDQKLERKLPNKPVYAKADARYVRMAIENLISNATKYTEVGGTISVGLRQTKTHAIIQVEDTGVGVHEKYFHLLFRKFSRVPNALSGQVSGSGIGLYLAKKVVDAHNGRINFKSADGKGSVCTISLPLYKDEE